MKIRSQILWPSLCLLLVLVSSVPALAEEVHVGKLVTAGNGTLVISDADDANEAFSVSDDATITRNGKTAELSDLAAGDSVTVTATRKKGKLIATRIAARTGK